MAALAHAPARLTLVSDTDTIVLRPDHPTGGDPIVCTQWDLGAPAVRENVADRPGSDGTDDDTFYTGSRVVTLDLTIFGDATTTAYGYVQRLVAMTSPRIRPKLQIYRPAPETEGETWELELRGNPYSLTYDRAAAARLNMQMQFTAPLGLLEAQTVTLIQSHAANAGAGSGFYFPLSFPLSTGNTTATNPVLWPTVGGDAPISPVIRIYGPVTNPELRDDADNRFLFSGLTLTTINQFVEIDMDAGTVRIGGSPDASVYHLVDFAVSSFWQWLPGEHTVRLIATSGYFTIQWRERRYSI